MLAISHTLIGASAGVFIENPTLSFMSGVILHLFADKTVHYFPKTMSVKTKVALFDWLVSAIFIFFLYREGFSLGVVAGGIGGLSVDVALLSFKIVRESKIGKWHIERQTHTRNFVYLLKDISAIIVGLLIIWRWK